MSYTSYPPTVLVLAGNDPTGGAGLCADTQTLTAFSCHTAPVITCVTVQNTENIQQLYPLSAEQVYQQAKTVLEDMPIAAIKIGLLGSADIIHAVIQLLEEYPSIPVVLDPILAAGGGKEMANDEIQHLILKKLLPHVFITTPNSEEAHRLTLPDYTQDEVAHVMLETGCDYVCITGSHDKDSSIINRLYHAEHETQAWTWSRLQDEYHGSGCTFAAGVAGVLAQGHSVEHAVYHAQAFTWQSLYRGSQVGAGQSLPNRITHPYEHYANLAI